MKKLLALCLTLVLAFSAFSVASAGSNYPSKNVSIIVPWGAGGGVDVTTRVFSQYFEKYLGKTVVVQNVTGGGGSVGITQAVNSKPDGYTLLMSASPMSNHKYTVDGVKYLIYCRD